MAWTLDVDALVKRRVSRAALVLALDRTLLVALDADTGEFVALPKPQPAGTEPEFAVVALSEDGTRAVFEIRYFFETGTGVTMGRRVVVYPLAAGDLHEVMLDDGEEFGGAAFSPDGSQLAVSLCADDVSHLDLFDLTTYGRRRLWTADGWAGGDQCQVAWSPNGEYLAVGYMMRTTNEPYGAAVVRMDGATIAQYEAVELGIGKGAWLNDREVFSWPEYHDGMVPSIVVADVENGETRRIDDRESSSGCVGSAGRRLLQLAPASNGPDRSRMLSTALDGTDVQPFLTVVPSHEVTSIDIAGRQLPLPS